MSSIQKNNEENNKVNNITRRDFMKLATAAGVGVCGLTTLKPLLSSMNPAKDVKANSTKTIEVSGMIDDEIKVEKWLGKPVFIMKRSQNTLNIVDQVKLEELKDPQTDIERFYDRNWLVVIGVCTHLGCVPSSKQGDYDGWYCPCHGSQYDLSARIRKGPAPLNLEVPLYNIVYSDPDTKKNASKIIIGVDRGDGDV